MTSVLKSFGTSFLLHASLLAALYAIQPAPQTLTHSGKASVLTMTLAARPMTLPAARIAPTDQLLFEPLSHQLDASLDSADQEDLLAPRALGPLNRQRGRPHSLASTVAPPSVDIPVDRQRVLRRQPREDSLPEVAPEDPSVRPRPPVPRAQRSPTVTAISIDQFVGLEKETTADLSMNQPPPYPAQAIRERLEGVVLLELTMTREGKVKQVVVLRSSGHRILDEAATEAVARWRGRPAKRWGRAVESVERLPIRFRL